MAPAATASAATAATASAATVATAATASTTTAPTGTASLPGYLTKQLLKQIGIPFHIAPGEAEAECASLQRSGIVDAVSGEDVDTCLGAK